MYHLKPPLKVKCFQCRKGIVVKFCPPQQDYSRKNNWGYWTGQEVNRPKYICGTCLSDLYQNRKWDYLKAIKDERKRRVLRSYLAGGVV